MALRSGLRGPLLCVLALSFGCGTGDAPPPAAAGGSAGAAHAGASGSVALAESPAPAPDDTSLCAKYGGMDSVRQVTEELLAKITGDCRIRSFFAGLTAAGGERVLDCLSIQIGELFGCRGVRYAQAHAENGLECRDMRKSHIGLGITQADFSALVEDVGLALGEAGIDGADIEAAAAGLSALSPMIVEVPSDVPSRSECSGGPDGPEAP